MKSFPGSFTLGRGIPLAAGPLGVSFRFPEGWYSFSSFVFSAIRGCEEVVTPVRLDAVTDNVDRCLEVLVDGFRQVKNALTEEPVAISFAFPGPADYEAGIIGDLPNFPCFRGGVAMGPYLSEVFQLPVYINNDGNLFAYGEALAGALPALNKALEEAGSTHRCKNLLGITLGTGFGAGVVLDGTLLKGDNGCGGDVWLMRNVFTPSIIAEENVSIRAVKRVYRELSGDTTPLEPKDIFEIADGTRPGDVAAAKESFRRLGVAAADAIAHALDIVDGLVVRRAEHRRQLCFGQCEDVGVGTGGQQPAAAGGSQSGGHREGYLAQSVHGMCFTMVRMVP